MGTTNRVPTTWLSTAQAAKELGVSVDTVRRWCTERGLPYSDIGRVGKVRIRINAADLDAWVANPNKVA